MTATWYAVWSGSGHGQAIHSGLQPGPHVSTAGLCNLPDGIPLIQPGCLTQLILPSCSLSADQPFVGPGIQGLPDLLQKHALQRTAAAELPFANQGTITEIELGSAWVLFLASRARAACHTDTRQL